MNNRNRKIIRYSLIIMALVSVMVFICEEAFARAGGGGGYSGGSSGGSSSGSSGGGGGGVAGLIFRVVIRFTWEFLMYLCREYPFIGYPLTVLFVLFLGAMIIFGIYLEIKEKIYGKPNEADDIDPFADGISTSSKSSSGGFNSGKNSNSKSSLLDSCGIQSEQNSNQIDNSVLRTIQAKDPDFSKGSFCTRAKKAFKLIQEAWSKRDLSKVEAFLGDGTYEQFLIQLDIMKEKHLLDVMDKLQIIDTDILGYESNNSIDSVFLMINASGKNYFIDDRTNKYVKGDKEEKSFTEIWTFIRRTGTKTLGKPGLIEGYCPNCGNKISIGRHTNCSSCGCLLRSGEHDWVLSNITQNCEWSRHNNILIPGYKKYIAFDEGFNVQHIEDLVSMMFWRKASSDRLKNIATFRKIATDKYCETLQSFYNSKDYKFYDDCAVGSIKVIAIDTEKSETEDNIYVEVAWDGVPKKDKETEGFASSFKKMFQKRELVRSVFVLKRKRGVMTDTRTSLCAAPCPNCGAMENNSSSNECEYCGTVMNNGDRDWVVENIIPVSDSAVDNAISRIKRGLSKPIKFKGYTKPQPKKNIQNPAPASVSTPVPNIPSISPAMAMMASSVAGSVAASKVAIPNINTNNNSNLSLATDVTPVDNVKWLIGMMLVDAKVSPEEFAVVYDYAKKIGLDDETITTLVKTMKGESRPIENLVRNVPIPQNDEFIQMAIRLIFADGVVSKEELNMLRYIAKRVNYPEIKMRHIFEMEKRRYYQTQQTVH